MTNPTEAPAEAVVEVPATPVARLKAALAERFGERVKALPAVAGEVAIEVTAADWRAVCAELRDAPELCFEQLVDLSGIDYLHYGIAEWKTESATRSGFSRGGTRFVGLGADAPAETAQSARRRGGSPAFGDAQLARSRAVPLRWRRSAHYRLHHRGVAVGQLV